MKSIREALKGWKIQLFAAMVLLGNLLVLLGDFVQGTGWDAVNTVLDQYLTPGAVRTVDILLGFAIFVARAYSSSPAAIAPKQPDGEK